MVSYRNSTFNTIDFILLLVAHGLRHGLFKDGKTLPDVLSAAMRRVDRRIRWNNPLLPLVPSLQSKKGALLDLSNPAGTGQAALTFTAMGNTTGISPQLLIHDIRRGRAKVLARLDQDTMKLATKGVMRGLGHHNFQDPCVSLTATGFVALFSSYNVVANTVIAGGKTPPLTAFEGHVGIGNTRDTPTRFQFRCKFCLFATLDPGLNRRHLASCTARPDSEPSLPQSSSKVVPQSKKHPCPSANDPNVTCDKTFISAAMAARHALHHVFTQAGQCPRKAECGNETIFPKFTIWEIHYFDQHHGEYMREVSCPEDGCSEVFKSQQAYNLHLMVIHKMKGDELKLHRLNVKKREAAGEIVPKFKAKKAHLKVRSTVAAAKAALNPIAAGCSPVAS